MSDEGRADPAQWLRAHRTVPDPAVRLLCFPHAGAGPGAYRPWAQDMPPRTELWAPRYPGREDRLAHPFAHSLAELADDIAAAVAAGPGREVPLALFGHSMGAVLAHEVTVRLERTYDLRPVLLAVSAREGPLQVSHAGLHLLDDEDLLARTAGLGIQPQADAYADPELRELLLPALRDDCRLLENHPTVPVEQVRAPVLAFAGRDDRASPRALMESWAKVTTDSFRLLELPGDHFYLFSHTKELLSELMPVVSGEAHA
ncbi:MULTISPECIES: thioesterase II family protein [unclassified Streptomyces]|uniref:thioesterase II family protein n=1 Tax=unclassified Streptomyces TaxID=2593676 RepID=UPI002258EEE6|nr:MULTISPECIES: alpha/beta fold hydrolase [unclassified Streptomyces]MCX4881491.1 alpha/beta fold hydrolase [Streptomyces sp. NBC_00847]MCX5421508.1 alpha/beta fold hydrolase [Streptomyces sp. NBC_00078]